MLQQFILAASVVLLSCEAAAVPDLNKEAELASALNNLFAPGEGIEVAHHVVQGVAPMDSKMAMLGAGADTGDTSVVETEEPQGGRLPISGWSDTLSGHVDSPATCTHMRDEITSLEERFKENTRKLLEESYGLDVVAALEGSLHAQSDKLETELERAGCFREDPQAVRISPLAVWQGGDPGEAACERLFQQRSDLAAQYQTKVRSMMLEKNPDTFKAAVDQLYTVTQSLHLRLCAQGCQGEGCSSGPAPSTSLNQREGRFVPSAVLLATPDDIVAEGQ